jgi:hypothetical protein
MFTRKKILSLALAVALLSSILALPAFAESIPGNYFYVQEGEQWVEAPMGQDTVYGYSLDPVTGLITVLFGTGYYAPPPGPIELAGRIVNVMVDEEEIFNPQYNVIQFAPTATGYITLDLLGIDMTFADNPDWNDPPSLSRVSKWKQSTWRFISR